MRGLDGAGPVFQDPGPPDGVGLLLGGGPAQMARLEVDHPARAAGGEPTGHRAVGEQRVEPILRDHRQVARDRRHHHEARVGRDEALRQRREPRRGRPPYQQQRRFRDPGRSLVGGDLLEGVEDPVHVAELHAQAPGEPQHLCRALPFRPPPRHRGQRGSERPCLGRSETEDRRRERAPDREELLEALGHPGRVELQPGDDEPLARERGRWRQVGRVDRVLHDGGDRRQVRRVEDPLGERGQRLEHRLPHRVLLEPARRDGREGSTGRPALVPDAAEPGPQRRGPHLSLRMAEERADRLLRLLERQQPGVRQPPQRLGVELRDLRQVPPGLPVPQVRRKRVEPGVGDEPVAVPRRGRPAEPGPLPPLVGGSVGQQEPAPRALAPREPGIDHGPLIGRRERHEPQVAAVAVGQGTPGVGHEPDQPLGAEAPHAGIEVHAGERRRRDDRDRAVALAHGLERRHGTEPREARQQAAQGPGARLLARRQSRHDHGERGVGIAVQQRRVHGVHPPVEPEIRAARSADPLQQVVAQHGRMAHREPLPPDRGAGGDQGLERGLCGGG